LLSSKANEHCKSPRYVREKLESVYTSSSIPLRTPPSKAQDNGTCPQKKFLTAIDYSNATKKLHYSNATFAFKCSPSFKNFIKFFFFGNYFYGICAVALSIEASFATGSFRLMNFGGMLSFFPP
jgi:hypothetical protein